MVISISGSWYMYSGMCNNMCRGVITEAMGGIADVFVAQDLEMQSPMA
jgi:hypothetical protein